MTQESRSISRRRFIQSAAASSVALMTGCVSPSGRSGGAKPNIVFILADDLGYADVSCYGQRDYTTPNIDRLAREGMKFTHGYANSSVCSPTRVALITGRYHMRLRIGLEEVLSSATRPPDIGLPPEHPTLPSLLRQAGYGTSLIGKWHLGYLPRFGPLKSGYDHFFGIFTGGADYFEHGSQARASLYEQETPVDRVGYMTNLLADRSVETIERHARSKQPFLLSLHFTAPHWPWQGPDDEAESRRINARQPPVLTDREGGTQKIYAAMVQNMDQNIGRVLRALEASSLADNTIVIFTSDNGGERFSDMWPFTGMKGELLEGGIRVPAIVRWPGRVPAGAVSDQPMITMDWLPTLLAAAGTRPDPAYPSDGENLLPVLTGKAAAHPRKLYWRYKTPSQRALRDGDWKYLRIAGNEFLFDVVKDPRERANLKGRHPQVFERLKADWEAWNGTMLPEKIEPTLYQNPGRFVPDRYGVGK